MKDTKSAAQKFISLVLPAFSGGVAGYAGGRLHAALKNSKRDVTGTTANETTETELFNDYMNTCVQDIISNFIQPISAVVFHATETLNDCRDWQDQMARQNVMEYFGSRKDLQEIVSRNPSGFIDNDEYEKLVRLIADFQTEKTSDDLAEEFDFGGQFIASDEVRHTLGNLQDIFRNSLEQAESPYPFQPTLATRNKIDELSYAKMGSYVLTRDTNLGPLESFDAGGAKREIDRSYETLLQSMKDSEYAPIANEDILISGIAQFLNFLDTLLERVVKEWLKDPNLAAQMYTLQRVRHALKLLYDEATSRDSSSVAPQG